MKINEQPKISQEDKFKQFLSDFQSQISVFYQMIDIQHREIFRKFWSGEFEPQEIVDKLGYEKSVALFQLSSALQAILKAGNEDYQILETPQEVVITNDSITIKPFEN